MLVVMNAYGSDKHFWLVDIGHRETGGEYESRLSLEP
jgi:hypothetical protein